MQDTTRKAAELTLPKTIEKRPIKWKKLASRELQGSEMMKLKTLLKRVLKAVGQADSAEARSNFLHRLEKSSQFQIHDGHVRLSRS